MAKPNYSFEKRQKEIAKKKKKEAKRLQKLKANETPTDDAQPETATDDVQPEAASDDQAPS